MRPFAAPTGGKREPNRPIQPKPKLEPAEGNKASRRCCPDETRQTGHLRQIIQTMPFGIEIFFQRCAAEFARPGAPDMNRILEIGGEHGIYFVNS